MRRLVFVVIRPSLKIPPDPPLPKGGIVESPPLIKGDLTVSQVLLKYPLVQEYRPRDLLAEYWFPSSCPEKFLRICRTAAPGCPGTSWKACATKIFHLVPKLSLGTRIKGYFL
jgi:hypothetical protein